MTLVCRDLDLDPKRYPPRRSGQQDLQPQERADRPRAGAAAASRPTPTRSSIVAEAYGEYQRRLREANAMDFDDLIMTTVALLQAFPDVAEHYRRRFRHVLVDEYQDTNHAQYMLVRELVGRDAETTSRRRAAGRAVRRRRRRPVDLRLPRRDDPQHPGVRAGLPERQDDPARAELPLHPDHPVRRQRGDRPQREPQAEEPVDRRGRGRADRRLRRRQRARRGRVRRRGDRPRSPTTASMRPATSPSSTGPTRSPACSRRCSSGSACPTRWSAACGSTSAARSGTRWPTCGCSPTPTTR